MGQGGPGSSALYDPRSIEETVAAHKGNLFSAAFDLNEMGIPPPAGRATWTAIVIESVLKEER